VLLLRRPNRSPARGGGTAVTTALLLTPMLLMVAFAVDLCNVWRTDAELQNAADAAALAGATQLVVPRQTLLPLDAVAQTLPVLAPVLNPVTGLVDNLTADLLQRQAATDNAVRTAQYYAAKHQAGGSPVTLAAQDVQVGYVADPSADPNSAQGSFQANSINFPNSVRVTVRQEVQLFFGAIFGVRVSSRQSTATATINGQGITGFNGSGSTLLPLAIDLNTFNLLAGLGGAAPNGITVQDQYTVNAPIQSNQSPPGNTLQGVGDGTNEAKVSTNNTKNGNFGTVSLRNSQVNTVPPYDNWIRNGPTAADLGTFGPLGLQASLGSPTAMFAGPALTPALQPAFQAIVGQPRTMLVYTTLNLGVVNLYLVVGFVGVTVTEANLTAANPYVVIQFSPTIDSTATRGGGPGSARLVYTGITLSR
jgi:Flp pilus assembly protein TadG